MRINFSFLRIGSKGQMFEGYELIIGAIMGLLIAMIILSAINYFSGTQNEISYKQLNEGFANALQNVLSYDTIKSACNNGDEQKCLSKMVVEKGLKLGPGLYSAKSLSVAFPEINKQCIEFRAPQNSTFDGSSAQILKINKFVKTDVYFVCMAGYNSISKCPILCIISISAKPVFSDS